MKKVSKKRRSKQNLDGLFSNHGVAVKEASSDGGEDLLVDNRCRQMLTKNFHLFVGVVVVGVVVGVGLLVLLEATQQKHQQQRQQQQ